MKYNMSKGVSVFGHILSRTPRVPEVPYSGYMMPLVFCYGTQSYTIRNNILISAICSADVFGIFRILIVVNSHLNSQACVHLKKRAGV